MRKAILISTLILIFLMPAAYAGSTAVIGAATAEDGSWHMTYTGDGSSGLTPQFTLADGNNWTIYWGDGTSTEIIGPVSIQEYTHTYPSSSDWQIRIMPGGGIFTYISFFNDDVSFNLASLPRGFTDVLSLSSTSVEGDIADLPSGLTDHLYLGLTSVEGDIADLPSGLASSLNLLATSVEGDIANLPTGLTGYLFLSSTSVEGDIANLPTGLTGNIYLYNTSVSAYTAESWPCNTDNGQTIDFDDLSLSETEVDNILCDLVDHGATDGTLDLTGNAAPSATGLACETTLETAPLSWTVTVQGE